MLSDEEIVKGKIRKTETIPELRGVFTMNSYFFKKEPELQKIYIEKINSMLEREIDAFYIQMLEHLKEDFEDSMDRPLEVHWKEHFRREMRAKELYSPIHNKPSTRLKNNKPLRNIKAQLPESESAFNARQIPSSELLQIKLLNKEGMDFQREAQDEIARVWLLHFEGDRKKTSDKLGISTKTLAIIIKRLKRRNPEDKKAPEMFMEDRINPEDYSNEWMKKRKCVYHPNALAWEGDLCYSCYKEIESFNKGEN